MSKRDHERTFDETVVFAADCLKAACGLEDAIKELQRRRTSGIDDSRVNEALAYLCRRKAAKDEVNE